jgi:anti-sigma factor RsiW
MDHQYFKKLLSAYLDKELESEQQQSVADHLAGCPECRRELERLEKLENLVERHSPLGGEAYWEESSRKIERRLGIAPTAVTDLARERAMQTNWWRWKIPAIAASVVLLAFIGLHQSDILIDRYRITPLERPAGPAELSPEDTETVDLSTEPEKSSEKDETRVSDQPVGIGEGEAGTAEPKKAEQRQAVSEIGEAPDRAVKIDTHRVRMPELPVAADDRLEAESTPELPSLTAPKIERGKSAAAPSAGDDQLEDAGENYKDREVQPESIAPRNDRAGYGEALSLGERRGRMEESPLDTTDLAYWRSRVDSLAALYTPAEATKGTSWQRPGVQPQSLALESAVSKKEKARMTQAEIEADLMEAWFNICRLSSDSTETRQGMQFLRKVAADDKSANQQAARQHIQALGKP